MFRLFPSIKMLLVLFIFSFVAVSCDKDDDDNIPIPPTEESIVDIASGDTEFSTLVAALTKANLAGTLAGNGPFTVFAPTNDAFAALLSDLGVSSLEDLTAEQLTPILLYHVVSGDVRSSNLSNGYVPTMSDGPNSTKVSLLVNTDSGVSLNSTTNVTTADIAASNGVIHVIDKVLLPPSVVSTAINNPAFSTLVSAVVKANLVDALSATGPFTVFAPTNDAFATLLSDLGASSLDDLTAEQLTPILLYHVAAGNNVSTGLSTGTVATLNTEASLNIDASNGVTINGNTNVIIADVQSTNGVVHAIDKVLIPNSPDSGKSIVDIALETDAFSTLVAALTKADLVSALQGDGPFTVFAPTNDAFAALLNDLGVSSLDDLTAEQLTPILLYHVVSGDVRSDALSNGYVSTLSDGPNGTKVSLSVDITNGVMLNNSINVTTADVEATNGVIHIIDKVLLPPSVVSTAINNPAFSTLVAAVVKANLVDALSATGPFTVFAPTNDAFAALLSDLGASSLDDVTAEQLTPILLYHVVSGNNVSTDLSSGMVSTLNDDSSLSIDVSNGVTINGNTQVIIADVQSTNGVVHAIDRVLMPAK